MYIVHIASELAPVAKVGGLADVLYGLSKEQVRLGHTVEIILPKYDCMHFDQLQNLKVEFRELWSFDGPDRYNNTIWSANIDGLRVLLVEPHHPQYFFSRGVIYGCHDDIDRFTYFSRTAIEYLFKAGKQPDILHVHDWPTAAVPLLYKEMYTALGYKVGGTVLTIHNMEHQGRCHPSILNRIGLRGENYLSPDKMQDPSMPNLLNLLKGGIETADRVTTVSPNYEKEVQTPEGGFGLQDVLVQNRRKLKGILNGIDEEFWNPELDRFLIEKYATHALTSEAQVEQMLERKAENKKQLRTHLGLKNDNAPIVAAVTRLVPQKGPHLIKHALTRTLGKGGQFVLLGSSPIPAMHQEFEELQRHYQESGQAAVLLDKDEALAHLIFAAADMLIIPSLFEPCGLTQMIALRYGTVPIARRTGGLADTVFDVDTSLKPLLERNGYTFDFPDAEGVNWALDRALHDFKSERKKWLALLMHGMRVDFSWKHAAPEYLSLYQEAIQKNAKSKSKNATTPKILKIS